MMESIAAKAYYEPHPDVMWFDDLVEVASSVPAKWRKLIDAEDPETGIEPKPRESKALPGTKIDRTFGACTCWLCRDQEVSKSERDWMFGMLAKDVLRKPGIEQGIWLQDWTLRHGKFAGEILKLHMWQQRCLAGTDQLKISV